MCPPYDRIVVVLCLRRFLCCWILSVPGGGDISKGWSDVGKAGSAMRSGFRRGCDGGVIGLRMATHIPCTRCTQVALGYCYRVLAKVFGLLFLLIDDCNAGCAG